MIRDNSILTPLCLAIVLFGAGANSGCRPTQPSDPLSVAIAIDLTLSGANNAGTRSDETTEYAENFKAAKKLVAVLTPGTRVSVWAITDQSFSAPVYTGQIPHDPGPYPILNQIDAKKSEIITALDKLSRPGAKFQRTDVLGALERIGEHFKESTASRKIVAVFGDMRNSGDVDIESPDIIDVERALKRTQDQKLIADLQDVDVYVFGIHNRIKNGRKSGRYIKTLRQYWTRYLNDLAGARLKGFYMHHDVAVIEEIFK